MATKLLTLASFTTLTLTVACQVAPIEPRREALAPVAISAPAPAMAVPLEPAAPVLAQEKAATPQKNALIPPKAKRPRPAALLIPSPTPQAATPALEAPTDAPSLSSQLSEIATPRVDKDDRPATGNVRSRVARQR
jgi:hypothetical protein